MSETETTFQRKLRERQEKIQAEIDAAEAAAAIERADQEKWASYAPEPEYERTEADEAIDGELNKLTMRRAYDLWAGKGSIKSRSNQVEIKTRCPNPGHPDHNPSFWFNTQKDQGVCAKCGRIDKYTIAAWHFGYPVPTTGADYPKLRRQMAEALGLQITESKLTGKTYVTEAPENASENSNAEESDDTGTNGTNAAPEGVSEKADADIINLFEPRSNFIPPALDLTKILPGEDTFLDLYMRNVSVTESPDEYNFFNALIALGLAVGRRVTLGQMSDPVFANLFICLLGDSGTSKSRSQRPLKKLIETALPYTADPSNYGTLLVPTSGSGEYLVEAFCRRALDPDGKPIPGRYDPVSGLIEYPEMRVLMSKGSALGSTLKDKLMEFYDCNHRVTAASRKAGITQAWEPFAAAITTTQPANLHNIVHASESASGFLNRWLFVTGPKKPIDRNNRDEPIFSPAVVPLQLIQGWSLSFGPNDQVLWEEDALLKFNAFLDTRVDTDKAADESDFLNRLDLLLMKLCLLFSINKQEKSVTLDTVDRVLSMYSYIIETYQIAAQRIMDTEEQRIVSDIERVIRNNTDKKACTLKFIQRALRAKGYKITFLERIAKTMITLGILEEIPVEKARTGGRGRPPTGPVYRLTSD